MCAFGLPKFDKNSRYTGPLSRSCGHKHKHNSLGRREESWNTSPSAAYPRQLCQFIVDLILDSCKHSPNGGGRKNSKRKSSSIDNRGDDAQVAKKAKTQVSEDNIHSVSSTISSTPPVVSDVAGGSPVVSDVAGGESQVVESESSFNIEACRNLGNPIIVEWDGKSRPFIDGLGFCSPTRWPPNCRGYYRSSDMLDLAKATFKLLEDTVVATVGDVRREAFRLATGNMKESPFDGEVLRSLRGRWAKLLDAPDQALVVDEGQPFLLRGLSQWLRKFEDPDCGWRRLLC